LCPAVLSPCRAVESGLGWQAVSMSWPQFFNSNSATTLKYRLGYTSSIAPQLTIFQLRLRPPRNWTSACRRRFDSTNLIVTIMPPGIRSKFRFSIWRNSLIRAGSNHVDPLLEGHCKSFILFNCSLNLSMFQASFLLTNRNLESLINHSRTQSWYNANGSKIYRGMRRSERMSRPYLTLLLN
jgi:hypothetical protein